MSDLEDRIRMAARVRDCLKHINGSMELQSLLYDLDLMPEQLERHKWQWRQMLILADWHRAVRKTT